jgi:glycosyltransferase involved in cell wall biosynthesis
MPASEGRLVSVTVIVPFHRNLAQLAPTLSAIRQSVPDAELIVAADGAVDDCQALAVAHRARVVVVPGPSGPAVARNRAAAVASGDVLVFVDADVVPAPDAIPGMCALLDREPRLGGVFGAYDHHPPALNFMSQFKNLSHTYVHEVGNPDAKTFWAGLGAVRRVAFQAVGGYDERFRRPSVEDIELGYRLVGAGYPLRLAPMFRGTHLKRWTLWNCIVTDIRARGIPWTQLIHHFKALSNDLNTSTALRASVVVSYLVLAAMLAVVITPWALVAAAMLIVALVGLNADYYRWFARERGVWFAVRVVGAHLVHHLCNGVSFVAGTVLHLASRVGLRLPGALPDTRWTADRAGLPAPPRIQPSR